MADTFPSFAAAARALLAVDSLSEKEGQFCGGLAFRTAPLSDKQANWLRMMTKFCEGCKHFSDGRFFMFPDRCARPLTGELEPVRGTPAKRLWKSCESERRSSITLFGRVR